MTSAHGGPLKQPMHYGPRSLDISSFTAMRAVTLLAAGPRLACLTRTSSARAALSEAAETIGWWPVR